MVLRRPRLDIQAGKVANALARIRETGLVAAPTVPVTVPPDSDDNVFLECAQSAEAKYLVAAVDCKGIPVVKPERAHPHGKFVLNRRVPGRSNFESFAGSRRRDGS